MSNAFNTESSHSKALLITGLSGCIGQALEPYLKGRGYTIKGLSRSRSEKHLAWQPLQGQLDLASLDDGRLHGVIHLSGENIAQRWTSKAKERILQSRVQGTQLLCQRLAAMQFPPKVLIAASAIGIYGCSTDIETDESASHGMGFLAEVTQKWEAVTQIAEDAGIRVVHLRIGMVLTQKGGVLKKLLFPFKLGLGAQLGNGQQYHSWVGMDDLIAMIYFCLQNETIDGPVNAVSPHPVTHRSFVHTLAKVLHRPVFFWVPQWVTQKLFGDMGKETVLASQHITPQKLAKANYPFLYPDLQTALVHIIEQKNNPLAPK